MPLKSIYACNPSYIVGCTNSLPDHTPIDQSHRDHGEQYTEPLEQFSQVKPDHQDQQQDQQQDQYYDHYIDLLAGRGEDVVKRLRRAIALSPNRPTVQFLAGSSGCGKTTELFRLKRQLEQQGFVVIYGAVDHYLTMPDVKSPEVSLLILYLVLHYLENQIHLQGKPLSLFYLPNAIADIENWLRVATPQTLSGYSMRLHRIFQFLKDHPQPTSQINYLRHYLEPCLKGSLLAVADELTTAAIDMIKQLGKKGLVILLDNLDHLPLSQVSIIFHEGGKYLQQFPCHIVYTIPDPNSSSMSPQTALTEPNLSSEINASENLPLFSRNGSSVSFSKIASNSSQFYLPKLQFDNHNQHPEVLNLLRQIILVRLLPHLTADQRLANITKVFDSLTTLDQLCIASHGHLPNLILLLYGCWQLQDPPFSANTVEEVLSLHSAYADLILGENHNEHEQNKND